MVEGDIPLQQGTHKAIHGFAEGRDGRYTGHPRAAVQGMQDTVQALGDREGADGAVVGDEFPQGLKVSFRFLAEDIGQHRVEGRFLPGRCRVGFPVLGNGGVVAAGAGFVSSLGGGWGFLCRRSFFVQRGRIAREGLPCLCQRLFSLGGFRDYGVLIRCGFGVVGKFFTGGRRRLGGDLFDSRCRFRRRFFASGRFGRH